MIICIAHDAYFETDEKISCRIDETIISYPLIGVILVDNNIDESILIFLPTS